MAKLTTEEQFNAIKGYMNHLRRIDFCDRYIDEKWSKEGDVYKHIQLFLSVPIYKDLREQLYMRNSDVDFADTRMTAQITLLFRLITRIEDHIFGQRKANRNLRRRV